MTTVTPQHVTVTHRVDLPESVRRGVGCPVPPVVTTTIDLTSLSAEDRARLGDRLDNRGLVRARTEEGRLLSAELTGEGTVVAPTRAVADLLAAIRAEDAAAEAYTARCAERAAARRAQAEALRLAATSYPWPADVTVELEHCEPDTIGFCDPCMRIRHARYRGMREHVSRPSQIPKALELLMQSVASSEAAHRRIWIAEHGSEHLQALAAEGLNYDATYQRERQRWESTRLEVERPGWARGAVDVEQDDLRDPPPAAMAILRAGRAVSPQCRLGLRRGQYVVYELWQGEMIYWPTELTAAQE